MKTIILRLAVPECDFGQLAAWFSELEDEPTSEPSLKEEYEKDRERILLTLAEDEQRELLGFYWAKRHKVEPDRLDFYLFVTPEQRGQGIGRQLYEALVQAAEAALQCDACHSTAGKPGRLDWTALGYAGDPVKWGGRKLP